MRQFLLLALLAALAGCATPREACETRATKDLRVLNRLIAESETNLSRGYATEREAYPAVGMHMCYGRVKGKVVARWCHHTETRYRTREVAIDLAEEQRKLDGMRTKREQLMVRARRGIAACAAAYPEE